MFLRGVLFVLFALPASTFAPETLTNLEIGKPVERQLASNEVHSYRIDLLPNQYAEVVVDVARQALAKPTLWAAFTIQGEWK